MPFPLRLSISSLLNTGLPPSSGRSFAIHKIDSCTEAFYEATMAAAAAGHANWIVGTSDGEAPHWESEDIEYVLEDFQRTSSCIAAKRGRLQDQMAAASRGRGGRARIRRAPVPAEGDAPTAPAPVYTRKGMGADRKRLRAQAGKAKKEQRRQEAVCGEFQELLADARQRDALSR